jgi:hypothetical protein
MNEGVLYFNNIKGEPSAVVIASTHSKASSTCPDCEPDTSKLTIEIYQDESLDGVNHQVIQHGHIDVGQDLLTSISKGIKSVSDEEYFPYKPKGNRDQERWLWRFFISSSVRLCGAKEGLDKFRKTLKKNEPSNFIAEMVWMLNNHSSVMDVYYKRYYSIFLINRFYMFG